MPGAHHPADGPGGTADRSGGHAGGRRGLPGQRRQLRSDALGAEHPLRLERKRAAAQAAFEQARLAAFGAEVGLALARPGVAGCIAGPLRAGHGAVLECRPWRRSLSSTRANRALSARAKAGPLAAPHAPAPAKLPEAAPGTGAAGRRPARADQERRPRRRVSCDREWCQREGLASYAAYPLVLEEKLVGMMSLFTEQPLTEQDLAGDGLRRQRHRPGHRAEALRRGAGPQRSASTGPWSKASRKSSSNWMNSATGSS